MQVSADVAAFSRGEVFDERESRLAARVIRRERIAATTVAGDAGPGHGLEAAAVEVDGDLARAVLGGEIVVLGEFDRGLCSDAGAAVRGIVGGACRRAPFDRVGPDVPLGIAPDRRLNVELARVIGAAIGRDFVILDIERDAVVVVIPARGHAPAVAEILHIAEHRQVFGAGANGAVAGEAVQRPPFV